MAGRICWKCGHKAHMTLKSPAYRFIMAQDIPPAAAYAGLLACDECAWPSLAISSSADALSEDGGKVAWLPSKGEGKDFPDVPEHIGSAADEAYGCFSIGALRGAMILSRAVIEATCKEKDAKGNTLEKRIDALFGAGHVRQHTRDLAHEVRHLGNEMAHGDFVDPVEPEEAEEILELMSEVLGEVYQSPARLERVRAKREAKKSGA